MRRTILSALIFPAAIAALALLWPADAYAQQRTRPRARPPAVAVQRSYRPSYRTYYRPYYRPYYRFYGSFYWQRYPWPPYPYPYPYPYYPYRYDDRAEIRIQVTPRDAHVYVDGYFAGLVDDFDGFAQRLHVEPGEHDIEIYLEGYRTRRERMLLRPRQSYHVRFALEPLAPGEAQEPRPSTSTPAAPPRGAAGERGAPVPAERESPGTLALRVQPADALVWIDGERWEWPEGEDRLAIDLPEGTHRVEVQREGHRAYSTTVTIRRGETTTLNVTLPRGDQGM